MLRLPNEYDPRIHKMVQEYLTDRILDLVDEYAFMIEEDDAEEMFEIVLRPILPHDYDIKRGRDMLLRFKALLESPEEFVPELAMEYIMAHLIYEQIDTNPEELVVPMPDRDYVYHIFKETENNPECVYYDFEPGEYDFENSDELEEAFENDLAEPSAYYKLNHIENMKYYMDELFWDIDFALLDSFSEEQLANAPAELGIGMEDRSREFILPPDWLVDK